MNNVLFFNCYLVSLYVFKSMSNAVYPMRGPTKR